MDQRAGEPVEQHAPAVPPYASTQYPGGPGEGWSELVAATGTAMRAVSDAMLPAIRQLVAEAGVVEALVRPLVYPRLRATYEAAGSPYGPAEDAMWRWWRDVAAAVREAAQEQGERAWETGLTELRRRIEAKRGP